MRFLVNNITESILFITHHSTLYVNDILIFYNNQANDVYISAAINIRMFSMLLLQNKHGSSVSYLYMSSMSQFVQTMVYAVSGYVLAPIIFLVMHRKYTSDQFFRLIDI